MESDSLAMIQFLEGNWAIPWSVVTDINYIQSFEEKFVSKSTTFSFAKEILLLTILLTYLLIL